MSEQPTCRRCGSPIQDTAYVCARCADVLAVALRNAAANWDELRAAVGRETALAGNGSVASSPRTLYGPTDIPCHHQSCLTVLASQIRARNEDAIPGETNLVSFGALEDSWIVTNTAMTWARLVEDETGRPIPEPTAPTALQGDPIAGIAPARAPQATHALPANLCRYSWLPYAFCACGHPHPKDAA